MDAERESCFREILRQGIEANNLEPYKRFGRNMYYRSWIRLRNVKNCFIVVMEGDYPQIGEEVKTLRITQIFERKGAKVEEITSEIIGSILHVENIQYYKSKIKEPLKLTGIISLHQGE